MIAEIKFIGLPDGRQVSCEAHRGGNPEERGAARNTSLCTTMLQAWRPAKPSRHEVAQKAIVTRLRSASARQARKRLSLPDAKMTVGSNTELRHRLEVKT